MLGLVVLWGFNNCTPQKGAGSFSSSSGFSRGCSAAPENLRNPSTINEVTQLINALPKPLSLPCFIENLSRPLKVFAMQSTFSAQLSESAETPRVFIVRSNKFVMSVVPTGIGKDLLELSEYINTAESVKAEFEFPIGQPLASSVPFDRIISGSGTNCRVCHSGEHTVAGFAGQAFASSITRPGSFSQLPSSVYRTLASQCNYTLDAYRCALMTSVFITGQAQDTDFP
jgi:hypothetical protein